MISSVEVSYSSNLRLYANFSMEIISRIVLQHQILT